MTTFYGTDNYSIDSKGRLAIPAQARKAAGKGNTFYLVPGFDGCLALYSSAEWARVEERLRQLPGRRTERAFKRALLMNATRVTVDSQGRITIPSALIRRAGLGKDAVLLGQGTHLEIWNPELLERELAEADARFEALAEEVLK
jgi:MraZ protein